MTDLFIRRPGLILTPEPNPLTRIKNLVRVDIQPTGLGNWAASKFIFLSGGKFDPLLVSSTWSGNQA